MNLTGISVTTVFSVVAAFVVVPFSGDLVRPLDSSELRTIFGGDGNCIVDGTANCPPAKTSCTDTACIFEEGSNKNFCPIDKAEKEKRETFRSVVSASSTTKKGAGRIESEKDGAEVVCVIAVSCTDCMFIESDDFCVNGAEGLPVDKKQPTKPKDSSNPCPPE